MKKILLSFMILFMFFLFSGCNSNNDTDTVKNGTYVMEQEGIDELFLPCVNISDDDILFSYDFLSSYLTIGSYLIEDGKLTMTTDDNKYTYVFEIDGDDLIFQKNESSPVNLKDRNGVKVTDNAIFHLKGFEW